MNQLQLGISASEKNDTGSKGCQTSQETLRFCKLRQNFAAIFALAVIWNQTFTKCLWPLPGPMVTQNILLEDLHCEQSKVTGTQAVLTSTVK